MKQKRLLKNILKACFEHNDKKLQEYKLEEYKKIFKRKNKGKSFDAKWTIVKL